MLATVTPNGTLIKTKHIIKNDSMLICNDGSVHSLILQGGPKVSRFIVAITLSTANDFHNFWHMNMYRKFATALPCKMLITI